MIRHLTLVPPLPDACTCTTDLQLDDIGNIVCYECQHIVITSETLEKELRA